MAEKAGGIMDRMRGLIPRNREELEAASRSVLKMALWLALLAPVVLVPAYYLLVTLGLAPPIHLPSG